MENSQSMQDGKKTWFEIQEKDVGKYKLIGTAFGFSFDFCVYLAHKYTPDLFERCCGYCIEKHGIGELVSKVAKEAGLPKDKQEYITVSFYEQKS